MAGKKQDISTTQLEKAFVRYAEVKNFKAVARELNMSDYVLNRRWNSLADERQQHYFDLAQNSRTVAVEEYVNQNSVTVIGYMQSVVNVRNSLLDKLTQISVKIDVDSAKSIYLIKEAANALKSITSISEHSDSNDDESTLDKLISQIKEQSTLR